VSLVSCFSRDISAKLDLSHYVIWRRNVYCALPLFTKDFDPHLFKMWVCLLFRNIIHNITNTSFFKRYLFYHLKYLVFPSSDRCDVTNEISLVASIFVHLIDCNSSEFCNIIQVSWVFDNIENCAALIP
jgi:hypothetical protein